MRKKKSTMIEFDRACELFSYDEKTGTIWDKRKSPPVPITLNNKNGVIVYLSRYSQLLGHRLAWLLHYGNEPDGHIKHVNGDKTDNRISNLCLSSNQKQVFRFKTVSYSHASRKFTYNHRYGTFRHLSNNNAVAIREHNGRAYIRLTQNSVIAPEKLAWLLYYGHLPEADIISVNPMLKNYPIYNLIEDKD
jgi:hypothetical protein